MAATLPGGHESRAQISNTNISFHNPDAKCNGKCQLQHLWKKLGGEGQYDDPLVH